MALESPFSVLSDLVVTNPVTNTDDPTEGAAHLRGLKTALVVTTMGTAEASKPVTTDSNIDTTGQRNLTITGALSAATMAGAVIQDDDAFGSAAANLVASSESIKAYVDAQIAAAKEAVIPAGTWMLFYAVSAPTGWTGSNAFSDHMLRVVTLSSGTGTNDGGSDSPILMNKVPSHTHGFTTGSGGTHDHSQYTSSDDAPSSGAGAGFGLATSYSSPSIPSGTAALRTDIMEDAGSHTHTGTTNANGSASNWTPKYVNVLLAFKNAY